MKVSMVVAASLLAAALTACNQKPAGSDAPAASVSSSGIEADASINQLMTLHVDPAADAIWDSVKVISNETGMHEHRPSTSEEWAELERQAQVLLSAAEMLKAGDRAVAASGSVITPGTLKVAEIHALIAAERPAFNARADAFGQAAGNMLAAIKARNADKISELGGELDEACEMCHKQFYYPDPVPAKAKSAS